jgi:hypothetical protein
VTIFAKFKRLTILVLALLGFVGITNRAAGAGTTNPAKPVWKQSDSYTIIVAQNETQTATNDKGAPTSASKESESKTDEKKDSSGVKKKPLKDFQPSERIEAEQAVDFPYDI